jgi:hypothetical protein
MNKKNAQIEQLKLKLEIEVKYCALPLQNYELWYLLTKHLPSDQFSD